MGTRSNVVGWENGQPLFAQDDPNAEDIAASDLRDATVAAQRCGIREGESLVEFICRLHDEANDDAE